MNISTRFLCIIACASIQGCSSTKPEDQSLLDSDKKPYECMTAGITQHYQGAPLVTGPESAHSAGDCKQHAVCTENGAFIAKLHKTYGGKCVHYQCDPDFIDWDHSANGECKPK